MHPLHTERVTIVMTPSKKADLAARAAARQMSIGQYIREKVKDDDEMTPEQEAEMAELVRQANIAMPAMAESLDRMGAMLRETNREIGATLREAGLRT